MFIEKERETILVVYDGVINSDDSIDSLCLRVETFICDKLIIGGFTYRHLQFYRYRCK